MPKTAALALDFVERRPKEAARELERLPAASVGQFLVDAPADSAARVVRYMTPKAAAAGLVVLPTSTVAALLSRLETGAAAAILRVMSPASKRAVLEELPTRAAIQCRMLLRHAPTEVGARMDANFATVADDLTIGDAQARLAEDGTVGRWVYVVDREGRLRGAVEPMRLMRADSVQSVVSLMATPPAGFSSRSAIETALHSAVWADVDEAPVIGVGGRMIGLLRYAALRHVDDDDPEADRGTLVDSFLDLGLAYWGSLGSLLEAVTSSGRRRGSGRARP